MIKRIFIGIIFFVVGFGIAMYADAFFRQLIQDLFQWTTNNHIIFIGKDFYLFGDPVYFTSFGLVFLLFSIANRKKEIKKIAINALILFLLFSLLLTGISAFDAHFKLIECTACDDGTRKLGYNEINYGLILTISALLSTIPSLITLLKKTT
ncbi:conserved membrane protein of unknown function [Tenacibaculum sp. 190130A14a]|uniref:Uncharacterized protein n=1 Tax=Tenacibaculum polynesiense TaxID=3137857 RepID=A0ABP1F5Y1_9FLAO